MNIPWFTWRPRARFRLLAELLGALAGLGAILFFLVRPTVGSISQLHTNIAREYQQLETRYREGHNLRTLTQDIQKTKEALPALKDMFYDPRNPLERIQELENLAKEAGLEGEIAVTLPKGKEKALVLEMTARGSWPGIKRFFEALDRSPLYLIVERLLLSPSGGDAAATLVLRLYPLPTL